MKRNVFALADLHLDHTGQKSMEVFGSGWTDYENRIFSNWKEIVGEEDLVLVPGDISWAMRMNEATDDLARLDALPGTKLLLRGNHDYWWQSLSKLKNLPFPSLHYLQNSAFEWNDVVIYGTRGWMLEGHPSFTAEDRKLMDRELFRLGLSLNQSSEAPVRIAMMHYPPHTPEGKGSPFWTMLKEANIDICVYGHLHGMKKGQVSEGKVDAIDLYCVSADYVGFAPVKIWEGETHESDSRERL